MDTLIGYKRRQETHRQPSYPQRSLPLVRCRSKAKCIAREVFWNARNFNCAQPPLLASYERGTGNASFVTCACFVCVAVYNVVSAGHGRRKSVKRYIALSDSVLSSLSQKWRRTLGRCCWTCVASQTSVYGMCVILRHHLFRRRSLSKFYT